MVPASIASLNVTCTAVLIGTPVAEFNGDTPVTVGGVVSTVNVITKGAGIRFPPKSLTPFTVSV